MTLRLLTEVVSTWRSGNRSEPNVEALEICSIKSLSLRYTDVAFLVGIR